MSYIVKDCCYCVELRTGALIIGYLHLAANIILPLVIIFNVSAVYTIMGGSLSSEENLSMALIVCLVLAVVFLSLVFNILYLVGIQKNKPGYVKAYVGFLTFAVVLTLIAFINGLAKGVAPEDTFGTFLNIALQSYFLAVVRSYHLKMLTPERGPAIMDKA